MSAEGRPTGGPPKTNWWLVALISLAVLLSGVGLVLVAAFVFVFMTFGDDDDIGLHAIDAEQAATAMERRGIAIPGGFTFGEMTEATVFTGADFYRGRYAAPGDFAEAKRTLVGANSDFPIFRSATCGDEIVHEDFVGGAGFRCDSRTELAVSTRTLDGADVLTDNYMGTPPDTETVLLARNGDRVELFVLSRGH